MAAMVVAVDNTFRVRSARTIGAASATGVSASGAAPTTNRRINRAIGYGAAVSGSGARVPPDRPGRMTVIKGPRCFTYDRRRISTISAPIATTIIRAIVRVIITRIVKIAGINRVTGINNINRISPTGISTPGIPGVIIKIIIKIRVERINIDHRVNDYVMAPAVIVHINTAM